MRRISLFPAWLYQRFRPLCDHLLPALGMAGIFLLVAQATDLFPSEWCAFIAAGVLISGLITPVAGYVLFVLSLVLPLYSISIYVAALSLAALLPPIFFLPRFLPAVILVIAAPILAQYQIALALPFLAGLLWAEWGGALVGLGSALWLKIFAGMCGAMTDLTRLGSQPLEASQLIARFQAANSIQILRWPLQALTPDHQTSLSHVLQILAWGLAGYGIGIMSHRLEGARRPTIVLLAGVSLGLLGLGVGIVGAPVALGLLQVSDIPLSFLVECGWGCLIVMGARAALGYLTRPAVAVSPSRIEPYSPAPRPSPEPAPVTCPRPRDEEQTGIIMIDLD